MHTHKRLVPAARATCALATIASAIVLAGCAAFSKKAADKPHEPLPDLGPLGVPLLSAGNGQTCGLHGSGSLYCWGRNAEQAPAGEYRRISTGFEHACAIRAQAPRQGEIDCWGRNAEGQTKAPTGIFIDVAAGYDHSCALRPDGRAVCWGRNGVGQSKPPASTGYTRITAGKGFTCALSRTHSVDCWGDSTRGESAAPAGDFVQLSSGPHHSCGVLSGGRLECWGNGDNGETKVPDGEFRAVAAGLEHTCALRTDGAIACWGNNAEGQAKAPAGQFYALAAGWLHTCAIAGSGSVQCWGKDYYGESQPHAQFLHVTLPESAHAARASTKDDEKPAAAAHNEKPEVPAREATSKRGDDAQAPSKAQNAAPKGDEGGSDMSFNLEETSEQPAASADGKRTKREEPEAAREEPAKPKAKEKPLDYFLKNK